jgi:hypothetical protein
MTQSEINTPMNQQLTTALEVTLSLYNSIDGYKFPADVRLKYQALGQCLRSLLEQIPNEPIESN